MGTHFQFKKRIEQVQRLFREIGKRSTPDEKKEDVQKAVEEGKQQPKPKSKRGRKKKEEVVKND